MEFCQTQSENPFNGNAGQSSNWKNPNSESLTLLVKQMKWQRFIQTKPKRAHAYIINHLQTNTSAAFPLGFMKKRGKLFNQRLYCLHVCVFSHPSHFSFHKQLRPIGQPASLTYQLPLFRRGFLQENISFLSLPYENKVPSIALRTQLLTK